MSIRARNSAALRLCGSLVHSENRSCGPSWRRMGVAEEAKTRGFPPPSLGGFGFIVVTAKYIRKLPDRVIYNISWTYSSDGNVRSGLRFQPVDATHSLNFSAGE